MPTIIPLDQVDPAMVEELLDRAFGPDRHGRTAYSVREGTEPLGALSFAALDDDDWLAGSIQCWPVALTDPSGRPHPMIMVGPVAVVPELQNAGYGKALMLASIAALQAGGAVPLPQVLIGDADYYGRFFGFVAQPTQGWSLPGPYDPARLLVRAENLPVLPQLGALGPWRG
ncbi:GNAT family N-acetyltransferase [Croceicoccus marinus]|jgi:predicted N-acetyltransferase YhbS|uniref:N-acetyltransferase n=1 Tax=Croceicoccus marinus TaxID=450378 RepID=A0A7G6VXY1_9SPHN|nr:N-acetyltransferase [Croceicoccus marinus]QNE06596.1 N-acetyltransferase [Croceicoccus marinus]